MQIYPTMCGLVGGACSRYLVTKQHCFPAGILNPGEYRSSIRATGYEAANPETTEAVGRESKAVNLKLNKDRDIGSQLNSAEWFMSIPGTTEQKDLLSDSVLCRHQLGVTADLKGPGENTGSYKRSLGMRITRESSREASRGFDGTFQRRFPSQVRSASCEAAAGEVVLPKTQRPLRRNSRNTPELRV